jgi:hypothetical protein
MASTLPEFLQAGISTLSTAAQGYSQSGPDPLALLSAIYDTVEVRSNAAPPMVLKIRELGGAPSPYTRYLQPTIVFSGPAGRYVWAPYGEASKSAGSLATGGMLLAIAGVGFLVGRLTK